MNIHFSIWSEYLLTGNFYTFKIWQLLSPSSHSMHPQPHPKTNGVWKIRKKCKQQQKSFQVKSFHLTFWKSSLQAQIFMQDSPLCIQERWWHVYNLAISASCVVRKLEIFSDCAHPVYIADSLRLIRPEFSPRIKSPPQWPHRIPILIFPVWYYLFKKKLHDIKAQIGTSLHYVHSMRKMPPLIVSSIIWPP